METINLTIPNMKNTHCQMTVIHAVKAVGGNTKSVAPTKADIELRNGLTPGSRCAGDKESRI